MKNEITISTVSGTHGKPHRLLSWRPLVAIALSFLILAQGIRSRLIDQVHFSWNTDGPLLAAGGTRDTAALANSSSQFAEQNTIKASENTPSKSTFFASAFSSEAAKDGGSGVAGTFQLPYVRTRTTSYHHANATLFTLCRNSDLFELLATIQNVEDRFNKRFHYPWVFLNDKPFSPEFVHLVLNLVSGSAYFDTIPTQHWSYPTHIDLDLALAMRTRLAARDVKYGDLESYRHMCRFQSGFFFDTSFMAGFKYHWRIEPGISLSCDIADDVFKYMEDNNKDFGFVMSIFEYKDTIVGLWDFVKEFLLSSDDSPVSSNLDLIHPNSLLEFIIGHPDVLAAQDPTFLFADLFLPENRPRLRAIIEHSQYNLCHFWNNFEIANMDFFRAAPYRQLFRHLDATGGFFYSRYGDAVIHSVAAALFLDRDRIHWFNDVGYRHAPYQSCPLNDELYMARKCSCNQLFDFTFDDYSCTGFYLQLMGRQDDLDEFEKKKQRFGEDFVTKKYDVLSREWAH